ncbi:MAG: efflux RND transporter permease subunit [Myxococcales bacterium]|nr:efflux RND transporter permease subunit [Myxococcales bacterium]
MIAKLIALCARHRLLVVMLSAVACIVAVMCLRNIPLDAIPDLSDTQVIVYSRWEQSPDRIEDQVTYPIITSLLGAPKVKGIRGFSDFGYSYVYVLFEDGTDIYWARSRVLEYLSKIKAKLPKEVATELGPDATGVGWVFQYALVDESGQQSLSELRSYQDWFLRFAVQSVPGVAEVASVGGAIKQYQVTVDPNRLQAYGISMAEVAEALRKSNAEVGGRLVEISGKEFMVRGRGYVQSVADLEQVVLRTNDLGTPLRIVDIGRVSLGPELRRGVADLDGRGEVVGGIVVMRMGEHALSVIERVKERLHQLEPSLPKGVRIVTTYDRSELILRAIDTLRHELMVEITVVSIIILLFLWHLPSAIVPIVTIPVAVLLSFIPLYLLGVPANLMSLSGIAISIGVLVDGAIVEVENAYRKIQKWQESGSGEDFGLVRLRALQEVGPSVFFSLLVIAVAFLPVFTLVDQEGRLFRPLALSKNLAMAIAAILAVTLDPALRMMLSRITPYRFRPAILSSLCNRVMIGTYHREEQHPISRLLFRVYDPVCRFVLHHPKSVIGGALLLTLSTIPIYQRLGSEFMPPLHEGSILYMPTTLPGVSAQEAQKILTMQDRILREFPEVQSVFGKAGRADTSTDPAPLSMMETTIVLRPPSQWRKTPRFYSGWSWLPLVMKEELRSVWPDHITHEELVTELDRALRIAGTTNAWTMPIKARLDMLSTGVRTPIGIKIFGQNPKELDQIGAQIEAIVRSIAGTRSVFAERTTGGYFLDFTPKREALGRYGLSVDDLSSVIAQAIGGESVTTTIEGRERYSVSLRYPRELRQDLQELSRALIPIPGGGNIPIGQVAALSMTTGPSMLRDENGMLAAYVYVDFDTSQRDIGSYVEEARSTVAAKLSLPSGYRLEWSGQFENMLRVRERLQLVVPLTILLIFLLLYASTQSAWKATIVLLAVPFSALGAIWLLYLLGYNTSVAVWVGVIALLGLDAETGVFMLMYLDLSYEEAKQEGRLRNRLELIEAVVHGAVKRVRPKAMTVLAALLGLLPILWSHGTGADVMKRIAAPMVGGLATSFLLELIVYPPIYLLWKQRELPPEDDQTDSLDRSV